MLYVVYCVDKPGAGHLRAQSREAHFAYLEKHKDILVLGGATLDEDDTTRTGSLLIINVADRAAADAFAAGEPLAKAGVFESVTVTRMRRGQWNPASAPATAEGE
jgi:uncharacterized protein YciI